MVQSGLKLQLLPCFIFLIIFFQFAPVGKCIIGQLEGIGFVRFYFSQRIVAELMCQDGIHNADKETFLLQHRCNWTPIHACVFHDDSDFSAHFMEKLDELLYPWLVMFHCKRLPHDFATRTPDSDGALAF